MFITIIWFNPEVLGNRLIQMLKINKNKAVAIVGLGYVGLPLAVLAAKKGYKVIGIDIDTKKVEQINKGKSPFNDQDLSRELGEVKILATTDFKKVKEVTTVIICVPTPIYDNRLPNYKPLEMACASVAPYLKKGDLVIVESTINPGVCEEIVLPIITGGSSLKDQEFLFAHCPERINPGDQEWKVSNIPRVVGGKDQKSTAVTAAFYRSLIDAEVREMKSLKEAEAVKVVENSFRNVNIAFVNELAQSFAKLGIDAVAVIEGAATKPFAFMPHFPGCGVGGHCIPVDPYYLIDYAKKNGYLHRFLSLACQVNEEMPKYTVNLFRHELEKLGKKFKGSRALVLGLSYKADIDDTRESPALEIIKLLEEAGVRVKVYDPHSRNARSEASMEEAIDGVDGLIVATNHHEFLKLNPIQLFENEVRVVIDGRNCLDKDSFAKAGIVYRGIGR